MTKVAWDDEDDHVLTVKIGALEILLHRFIGDPNGRYLTCHALGISQRRIGEGPLDDEAKKIAVKAVYETAYGLWQAAKRLRSAPLQR